MDDYTQTMLVKLQPWFEALAALPDMPYAHNLYTAKTTEGRTRLHNLQVYFTQALPLHPTVLLIGEAPGYQGTYRTGVNFCSEALMFGPANKFGIFGGTAAGYQRVFSGDRIWKEPSSTVVWHLFEQLPNIPVVWPAFPMHPYKPGNELSNRTPTASELAIGAPLIRQLIEILQPTQIAALGNTGAKLLTDIGIEAVKIRHPAHGGAPLFREQLTDLMRKR